MRSTSPGPIPHFSSDDIRHSGLEAEQDDVLWDSIDATRAAAGPDYETAVIPEERRKYLSRYDAKSAHYEIVSI